MKKKGFTLIELLAVIIILAILAFILIPIIQDLIANARYGAAANSVMNYVNAANTQAAVEAGGFEEYKLNLSDTYELDSEIDTEELDKIKYKGKGPTYVYLLFSGEEKYVSEGHFCMWGYSIDYNFETGTSKSDLDYCGGEGTEPEGDPTCDVLRNNKYDDTEVFKINNVEDLVCVSELSKTKTFENKTIYLIKDIDFNSDSSYQNINDTSFGDINGNGEIEGLKTELTTSGGFYPIGSSSVPFKGTFEGYAKSISNLMINRPQDNVGLFGYNQGKIQGFNISANVTGNNNIGGVVGYNNGEIVNEIIADVKVTALNNGSYVGGIVGNLNNGNVTNILMRNADIASLPDAYSGNYKGGIVGGARSGASNVTGVVENGSLKAGGVPFNGGGYAEGIITGNRAIGTGYASNGFTGFANGNNGTGYTLRDEMLNAYDKVLDTYIGGDNDNSGYYFDYENETSSNIVIKRIDKNPIKFTVKGNGTESSPYIIDSVQHYKEASTLAGKEGSYKLKITKDIDFTGRHYYALGTNGNALTSDIDGDMHTLSNIAFNCAENCGLISKNEGHKIDGLNLDNITITSSNENVGGLIGYNTGTIKGMNVSGINITGASNVGGLVGYNNGGSVNEIIASVAATTINDGNYVGGIVGNLNDGNVTNILMRNAEIASLPNAYSGTLKGGIVGGARSGASNVTGVVENGFLKAGGVQFNGGGYAVGIITGNKSIGTGYASSRFVGFANGNNGISYSFDNEMLNTFDKALDTYIGGDNDDSGYYFDYESEGSSNIVLKRIKDYPITFTLSGHGTTSDPYIIDNYQHFKEATLLAGDGNTYKFKITNNIDFSGKHYYSLGTLGNPLSSDIDGDMHTLSNISFNCAESCGLISRNINNIIEGLGLNNVTITSDNSNVGGIVGYNEGTIKGINASGMNITGVSNVGGIAGYSNGIINEVSASVKVTTLRDGGNVGGIVGSLVSGTVTNILMRNAEIESLPNAYSGTLKGGIVGGANNSTSTITGIVENGSLKAGGVPFNGGGYAVGIIIGNKSLGTGYASNKFVGFANGNNGTAYTLVPPTTVTYTENSNTVEVDSLTYYENTGLLDTVIGGDNDSSGYYLQYNNSADSIIVVKAGTPSGGGSNPGGNTNPDSPVAITGTPTGTNPPTCVLNQVIPRSNGIQAVLTCEDEEGAPTIRSQWNVNAGAPTNTFADIGIVKNGTVNGNSKTVRPYWSTSDPISIPHRGDCYYYRFGAQDASGNWTYYVTNECYHAFLD